MVFSFMKNSYIIYMKELLNSITDTRMVYLMMSIVLLVGYFLQSWGVVIFVTFMLNVGLWTGFCPSKWLFGKLGFKKTNL